MEIRSARESDVFNLKRIWTQTFQDTQEFTDWYFANRFFPRYTCCACEGGEIVSVCHALPAEVRLRGILLRCAVLNGVATLPKYRGRGLMRDVLNTLSFALLRDGFVLMSNTPADFAIYASSGYAPAGGAVRPFERRCAMPAEVADSGIAESAAGLYECYTECSEKYSGMLVRDEYEFERKCSDWQTSDSARAFTAGAGGRISGYAVFHTENGVLVTDEVIAMDERTYGLLDEALHSVGLPVSADFPADSGVKGIFRPKHALGIINAEKLMQAFDTGIPASVRLTDAFFAPNNGIFTLGCSPSSPPVITATAPQLIGWLSGYVSLYGSGAGINDAGTAKALSEALPVLACWNTDEY